MATIATRASEAVGFWNNPNTTLERVQRLEAGSQTFLKGNFVINSAGYIAIAASDNDGAALGIATRAGQSATVATKYSEFIPMVPGLVLEMNLLEASDAAHILALATDLWSYPQWQTTSSHHVLNTTSTTDRFFVVQIGLGAVGDAYGRGGDGDTNCRVLAVPVGSMCAGKSDV